MANVINALNPSLLVFGGELSMAAEFLMPVVEQVVGERAMRWPADGAPIRAAAYGFDSCAMAGAAMVMHDLFSAAHLRLTTGVECRRPVAKGASAHTAPMKGKRRMSLVRTGSGRHEYGIPHRSRPDWRMNRSSPRTSNPGVLRRLEE